MFYFFFFFVQFLHFSCFSWLLSGEAIFSPLRRPTENTKNRGGMCVHRNCNYDCKSMCICNVNLWLSRQYGDNFFLNGDEMLVIYKSCQHFPQYFWLYFQAFWRGFWWKKMSCFWCFVDFSTCQHRLFMV